MGISNKPLMPNEAHDLAMDKPIPPGVDQDAILNAVTDEITNRGFVIAKADKLFTSVGLQCKGWSVSGEPPHPDITNDGISLDIAGHDLVASP